MNEHDMVPVLAVTGSISTGPRELGWSPEQLAMKASINRTYIASLESGRRNPSLDLIARLAAAMKMVGHLVAGLEPVWPLRGEALASCNGLEEHAGHRR